MLYVGWEGMGAVLCSVLHFFLYRLVLCENMYAEGSGELLCLLHAKMSELSVLWCLPPGAFSPSFFCAASPMPGAAIPLYYVVIASHVADYCDFMECPWPELGGEAAPVFQISSQV